MPEEISRIELPQVRHTGLTLKDALRLAAKDQDFATMLIHQPETLQRQFSLDDKQVMQLQELGRTAMAAARNVAAE